MGRTELFCVSDFDAHSLQMLKNCHRPKANVGQRRKKWSSLVIFGIKAVSTMSPGHIEPNVDGKSTAAIMFQRCTTKGKRILLYFALSI